MLRIQLLILIIFISCKNDYQEIQEINDSSIFPIGITENIKLIYTDSAKVKAVLNSPKNLDFTNQTFPYSEFPEGIEIIFFDQYKNETVVTSDYAVSYSKTNIVDLVGSVTINMSDGSLLKTTQLYWDPEQEWLFTEKEFSFFNEDYEIIAKRLDANKSFTIFNTGELDGTVAIEDN